MPQQLSKSTKGNRNGPFQRIDSLARRLHAEGRIPTPGVLVRSIISGYHEALDPQGLLGPVQLSRSDRGLYHVLFVSPNDRDQPSTIRDAQEGLRGPRMQQLEALAPRGHSGIGFWRDGAEESRLIHTSPGTIQKAMAALGLKFNQKAVIGFTSHEDGSDTAHVLVVPRGYSPEKIHKDLMEHGIEYKTIIPGSEGKYTVHILDNGSALGDSVKSYAQKVGARHWSTPGSVVFIGGDTREDAKQQYQHVLRGS